MKRKILLLATAAICLAGLYANAQESEPNDVYTQANTLALNGSNSGAINVSGDIDWWKVTTNGDGKLNVTIVISNALYMYWQVYDNNGTTLLASDYTSGTKTLSPDGLAAGTYYIKCFSYYAGQLPAYTISNTLNVPAEANDVEPNGTKAQAKVLPLNGSKTGHVNYYYNGTRDAEDWYKVTTTADGNLRLRITSGNGEYFYAYLFDNDGTTQLAVDNTSTTKDFYANGLAAGTYYIRINSYYEYGTNSYTGIHFEPYTLSDSLFTPAQANDIEPNNTKAQAKFLPLNGSKTGHINYYYNNVKDTYDWFKVTTNADGRLRLKMESANGQNVWAYLFDNDGTTLIASGYTSGTAFVVNADGLAAGTYYIRVNTFYSNEFAPYTLSDSLFTPAQANDPEPNDTKAQSVVFAPNSTITGHTNYYYNLLKDGFDWYSITIPDDGNININITSNNGQNVWAYLFDNDGSTVIGSAYTSTNTNYNVDGLQAGTYYMRVNTFYTNEYAPYTIANTFTTYNNATDTAVNKYPYQAKTMKANETTTGHVNFYYNNQKDSVDWYKINYTGSGALTLNILQEAHISNSALQYLRVYVYKDTLSSPIASQYSAGSSWQMNLNSLTQGYYYIRLNTFYTNEFVSYSVENVFNQVNIAKIKVKSYDTISSCSSTNKITFKPNKSKPPYTIQLYRFGVVYGAPVIRPNNHTITFNNLPTGSYYATIYGDGATGAAFSKSKNIIMEPVPDNLSTSNITDVKAKLNWDPVECAGYYTIQFRVQGDLTWIKRKTKNASPYYIWRNLTPNTTYEWQVATSDSANGIVATSPYSSISTFTTNVAFAGKNGNEVSLTGKGNIKEATNSISVFPNPASNFFTIRYNSSKEVKVNAVLYNLNGKAVWASGATNASALNGSKVVVNTFASGLYYLKIMDEKGVIQSVTKVSVIK